MRFVDPSGHNAEQIAYIAEKNNVTPGVAKDMYEADLRSGQNNYGAFDNTPVTGGSSGTGGATAKQAAINAAVNNSISNAQASHQSYLQWLEQEEKNNLPPAGSSVGGGITESIMEDTFFEDPAISTLSNQSKSTSTILQSRYGVTNDNVLKLQQLLISLGYYYGLEYDNDKHFGENTLAALMRFQMYYMQMSFNDLFTSDGYYIGCDGATAEALNTVQQALNVGDYYVYQAIKEAVTYKGGRTNPRESVKIDGYAVKKNLNYRVSKQNLVNIGFTITEFMLYDLNRVLEKYGITSRDQIHHFIAQVYYESTHGTKLRELYDVSPQAFFGHRDFYYETLKADGSPNYYNDAPGSPAQYGDGAKYRGAGYIQLTWKTNYYHFSQYIGDSQIVPLGYAYIASDYPWESAGWYWSIYRNCNARISSSTNVSDVTRWVNGGQEGLNDRILAYKRITSDWGVWLV